MAVTAALWPFGLLDRGLAELRGRRWPAGGSSTPVLLIHGYGANKSNWLFLRRELLAAGYERVHAVNYNPLRTDIPDIAAVVVDRARAMLDRTGADRVHLVGHSTGGIVARWAVQVLGLSAATCVAVASPHEGAPAARWWVGRTAQQLRPGSEVLERLRRTARPLPTRFVAYYSNLDLLCPARSARITEPALAATNILVKDEGHLSMLLSRRLCQSIVAQLEAAEADREQLAPVVPFARPAVQSSTVPVDDDAGNPPAIHRMFP